MNIISLNIDPIGQIFDIPGGLLGASWAGQEITPVSISPQTFSLRLSVGFLYNEEGMYFSYYDLSKDRYEELYLSASDYALYREEVFPFYKVASFYVGAHEGFRRLYDFVSGQYESYIEEKLYNPDYSGRLCGYPSDKDGELFSAVDSFLFQERQTEDIRKLYEAVMDLRRQGQITLARNLSEDKDYEAFLSHPADCDQLYIGNFFCPLLFPDRELLTKILIKACKEEMGISIVLSYLRQEAVPKTKSLLSFLYDLCKEKDMTMEVVIGDLGQLMLMKPYLSHVKPVLGPLLNKRRRDPRMKYKLGMDHHDRKDFSNMADSTEMKALFHDYDLQRIEEMSPGYEISFTQGLYKTLHLPICQTNTSQYCPLYALHQYDDRGHQEEPADCGKVCKCLGLSYPSHLHMFGQYNSLFFVDHETAGQRQWLENYLREGVDRILWNLWI